MFFHSEIQLLPLQQCHCTVEQQNMALRQLVVLSVSTTSFPDILQRFDLPFDLKNDTDMQLSDFPRAVFYTQCLHRCKSVLESETYINYHGSVDLIVFPSPRPGLSRCAPKTSRKRRATKTQYSQIISRKCQINQVQNPEKPVTQKFSYCPYNRTMVQSNNK